jgi:hypothetical protein
MFVPKGAVRPMAAAGLEARALMEPSAFFHVKKKMQPVAKHYLVRRL